MTFCWIFEPSISKASKISQGERQKKQLCCFHPGALTLDALDGSWHQHWDLSILQPVTSKLWIAGNYHFKSTKHMRAHAFLPSIRFIQNSMIKKHNMIFVWGGAVKINYSPVRNWGLIIFRGSHIYFQCLVQITTSKLHSPSKSQTYIVAEWKTFSEEGYELYIVVPCFQNQARPNRHQYHQFDQCKRRLM